MRMSKKSSEPIGHSLNCRKRLRMPTVNEIFLWLTVWNLSVLKIHRTALRSRLTRFQRIVVENKRYRLSEKSIFSSPVSRHYDQSADTNQISTIVIEFVYVRILLFTWSLSPHPSRWRVMDAMDTAIVPRNAWRRKSIFPRNNKLEFIDSQYK